MPEFMPMRFAIADGSSPSNPFNAPTGTTAYLLLEDGTRLDGLGCGHDAARLVPPGDASALAGAGAVNVNASVPVAPRAAV